MNTSLRTFFKWGRRERSWSHGQLEDEWSSSNMVVQRNKYTKKGRAEGTKLWWQFYTSLLLISFPSNHSPKALRIRRVHVLNPKVSLKYNTAHSNWIGDEIKKGPVPWGIKINTGTSLTGKWLSSTQICSMNQKGRPIHLDAFFKIEKMNSKCLKPSRNKWKKKNGSN